MVENNLTKHSYDTTVEAELDGTTARSATNVERRTSSGGNAVRRLDVKRDRHAASLAGVSFSQHVGDERLALVDG